MIQKALKTVLPSDYKSRQYVRYEASEINADIETEPLKSQEVV